MSTTNLKKVEDAFSARLKVLRLERGWSQEDLASRLDVSPGSVGNWEMGPHVPHPKTLRKIAALFEVEVFYLTHGERTHPAAALREKAPEQRGTDLAEILREVEDVRERLGRIAEQLRKATAKSGAANPTGAAALTEVAAASYDQKRGTGKSRGKETPDSEAQRIVARSESRHSK